MGSSRYERSSGIRAFNQFNPPSVVGASALRTMGRGGGRADLSMVGWVRNATDRNCPAPNCEVVSPILREVPLFRRYC